MDFLRIWAKNAKLSSANTFIEADILIKNRLVGGIITTLQTQSECGRTVYIDRRPVIQAKSLKMTSMIWERD